MTDAAASNLAFAAVLIASLSLAAVSVWAHRPRCHHPDLEAKLTELVRTLADLNARNTGDTRP
jgi:hypothetical protein